MGGGRRSSGFWRRRRREESRGPIALASPVVRLSLRRRRRPTLFVEVRRCEIDWLAIRRRRRRLNSREFNLYVGGWGAGTNPLAAAELAESGFAPPSCSPLIESATSEQSSLPKGRAGDSSRLSRRRPRELKLRFFARAPSRADTFSFEPPPPSSRNGEAARVLRNGQVRARTSAGCLIGWRAAALVCKSVRLVAAPTPRVESVSCSSSGATN